MKRQIPKKNYIILTIILILTLTLTLYFYKWYQTYEKDMLNYPIISEHLFKINYNEINEYITENPSSAIYVSKLGSEEIRNFEKNLIPIINKYQLKNNILYLNVDNSTFKSLKEKYKDTNYTIDKLPCILIFKNSKLSSIYKIDYNNYNINEIINYLQIYEVIMD